ncbi:MAG: nitroreductase family protein [Lentisphaeria bacterium]|nr:nitroreductase family protein [Lentisphaeria bacterium]
MFLGLMKKCRSCRRFDNSVKISDNDLTAIMECTRFAPTAGNLQNLDFYVTNDENETAKIFAQTKWAALYKNWEPAPHERPTAFIVICTRKNLEARRNWLRIDVGIAAQTIMLAASNIGLSGCMIGSFNEKVLLEELKLEETHHIELVIALGKANEKIVWEDAETPNDYAYYRDENDVHHVPKRKAADMIINK